VPVLARITIYPVKSLDGQEVPEATVLPAGALEHDRRFALVDARGRFVNGKRTALVHRIRSWFDPQSRTVSLGPRDGDDRRVFHLDADRDALHAWLTEHFGFPVRVVEEAAAGLPDDTAAPGPTVLSTGTLEEVGRWFPGLDAGEVRHRFRANLELGDVGPFWEDRLYAEPGQVVRFRVGAVVFEGVNPCQRCVVPTRSATTGEPVPGFATTFAERRWQSLPPWTVTSRFDHFYRLAVNTRPSGPGGGTIRVGDEVTALDVVSA
jgi:uncharacterized protein YcbX